VDEAERLYKKKLVGGKENSEKIGKISGSLTEIATSKKQ
jgi:hypothetical protein